MEDDITIDPIETPPEDTEQSITDLYNQQAGLDPDAPPELPAGTVFEPVMQEVQDDELLTEKKLGDAPEVTTTKAEAGPDVVAPEKTDAPQIESVTDVSKELEEKGPMEAAKGEVSEDALIKDVPQGEVSKESIAEAAQGEVSKESTVQYQIGELMSSIEEGKPLPAWASGAARGATAVMQQRGLGASSMASAAMIQALMEAGIPIAAADAQTYAGMDLANLNNRQQAVLQNAATYAAMDRANLDARMTAAVNNAKAFLSIDLQNLDNEQKTATLNYQSAVDAMFKDQAYEYAAAQFNAQTTAQVDQFFAELDVQVQNANSNRISAMNQFNAGEENAMAQFSASLKDSRERFDVEMATQIEQANALWRREVNTQNTAAQNEANRTNTQNLLAMTQTAQAAMWQKYADEAAFVFQMTENEAMRSHQVAMLAMESEYNMDLYERKFELDAYLELGKNALRAWG